MPRHCTAAWRFTSTARQFDLHDIRLLQLRAHDAFIALNLYDPVFHRTAAAAFLFQLGRQFVERSIIQIDAGDQAYALPLRPLV